MKRNKSIKVIFDTNIWISFLIGKRLSSIKNLLSNQTIQLVFSDQIIEEIKIVTRKPKLQRYFSQKSVSGLIELMNIIGEKYVVNNFPEICRDPKDDYLLALINESQADYLVTGDNDLLEINSYQGAKILTTQEFERLVNED